MPRRPLVALAALDFFLSPAFPPGASSAEDLKLGGGSYRGDMEAELGFNAIAPYVGIGWTSGRADRRGFSFFADAGSIFQDALRISASGRVKSETDACGFSLSESGRAGCGPADLRADHPELGTVPFDRSKATFRGSNVPLSTAVVSVTGSSGKWAGQFSDIPDGSGRPRQAVGTFDATASASDGSAVAPVGGFGAGHTR